MKRPHSVPESFTAQFLKDLAQPNMLRSMLMAAVMGQSFPDQKCPADASALASSDLCPGDVMPAAAASHQIQLCAPFVTTFSFAEHVAGQTGPTDDWPIFVLANWCGTRAPSPSATPSRPAFDVQPCPRCNAGTSDATVGGERRPPSERWRRRCGWSIRM